MVTMSFLGRCAPFRTTSDGVAKAALEAATVTSPRLGRKGSASTLSRQGRSARCGSGVGDFRKLMEKSAVAPCSDERDAGRGGNAAAYLLSDWASGVTGEVHYVDAGFNSAEATGGRTGP